jgi:hypothetical protein
MNINDIDRNLNAWFDAVEPRTPPAEILPNVFAVTRRVGQRRGLRARLLAAVHVGRLDDSAAQRTQRLMLAVASVASVMLIGVLGVALLAPGTLSDRSGAVTQGSPAASQPPASITGSLPAEQTAVIARHAAALNSRDAEAFVEVFAANGSFNPRGTFASSSSLFGGTLPIADRSLIEAFMAINEAWAFEAEIVSCDQLSKSDYDRRYGLHHDSVDVYTHCAVNSRWPALSLEIGEWWNFEVRGTEILWWSQTVRDATPADRALPLGLDGLLEWETWLESTDPNAAARLLNPRVYLVTVPCGDGPVFTDETHTTTAPPEPPCEWSADDVDVERITSDGYGQGEEDWVIAGKRFSPGALIPYDPAMADEIQASIEGFLVR